MLTSKDFYAYIDNKINEINNNYKNDTDKLNVEINELQEFLEEIFLFKEDDSNILTKDYFNKYDKYICISFFSTKKGIDGKSIVYNKFFNYNKLNPKRKSSTPLSFLIYSIAEDENFELYYSPSLYRKTIENRDGKKYFLDKKSRDAVMYTNSVFLDLDFKKPNLSKDDWLDFINENYSFLFNLNPTIIKSGGGLHIYFSNLYTFQINAFSNDNINIKKEIGEKIGQIFGKYNDMSVCSDVTKLLRIPFSYNRKKTYINPQKVEIIFKSNKKEYLNLNDFKTFINKIMNPIYEKNKNKELSILQNMQNDKDNIYISITDLFVNDKLVSSEEKIKNGCINIPYIIAENGLLKVNNCIPFTIGIDFEYINYDIKNNINNSYLKISKKFCTYNNIIFPLISDDNHLSLKLPFDDPFLKEDEEEFEIYHSEQDLNVYDINKEENVKQEITEEILATPESNLLIKNLYKLNHKTQVILCKSDLKLDFDDFGIHNNYRIRDMLFYLANRNYSIKGFRYNFLFLYAYCLYCYSKIQEEDNLLKYVYMINNKFKEPIEYKVIERQVKDLFRAFNEGYSKSTCYINQIRNNTIANLLNYQDIEMIHMIGSYGNEAEKQYRNRKSITSKEYYKNNSNVIREKSKQRYRDNGLKIPDKYKVYYNIFKVNSNSDLSYKEFIKELIKLDKNLKISRSRFYDIKKMYLSNNLL